MLKHIEQEIKDKLLDLANQRSTYLVKLSYGSVEVIEVDNLFEVIEHDDIRRPNEKSGLSDKEEDLLILYKELAKKLGLEVKEDLLYLHVRSDFKYLNINPNLYRSVLSVENSEALEVYEKILKLEGEINEEY